MREASVKSATQKGASGWADDVVALAGHLCAWHGVAWFTVRGLTDYLLFVISSEFGSEQKHRTLSTTFRTSFLQKHTLILQCDQSQDKPLQSMARPGGKLSEAAVNETRTVNFFFQHEEEQDLL